ncbi:sugar ABC transporter substrate-binding protein [Glaciibacter psychrotolerans]|uniref:Ribose transport system substrate-binding protein n=1 Tax=Glaciibacter psychrotolerans TaxID=670054 RepID=A0A7Z0J4H4_9MICO|nr:sugar ABC transporter substrate-binding protein [Leifsonia psychrotolerans]NYJ18350.1 ribose transport system substrate-binding protein [Leifsonia psychrotolerans]
MKISRRLSLAAALTLPVVFALTACSSTSAPAADDVTRVVVLTPYLSSAATKESIDEFTTQGEKLGWEISVVDTAGDMNKLNSAFQDAAAQQPDAIVLGSGDPTQISLGLKSAVAAGIPVFAMDAAANDLIAANVTSDNTSLGDQSASALIDLMGGTGAVVMMTHEPHPGVKARAAGARETFAAAGITVLEEKHVENPGAVDSARTSMQDIISSRGAEVTGVWGGWDEPALGVTQALNAAGVTNVPVVGVDGQDFALAEIDKKGPFQATIKQDWASIAGQVVALIQDLVDNGTPPAQGQYELPGTLITGTK